MQRPHWQIAALLILITVRFVDAADYLPPAQPTLAETLKKDDAWYKSDEGQRIADNIVSWQNASGGWWKTYDPKIPRPAALPGANPAAGPVGDNEDEWRSVSTFDNDATTSELRILARAHRVTGKQTYRDAFNRGLKFVFDAQYESGGWPQRFPLQDNYGRHITFNDGLMANVMTLLKHVATGQGDFAFVPESDRKRTRESFDRGIDCILNCQIKVNGKLTGWCQQHDAKTLEPVGARAYELPSISGFETTQIVLLLMEIENPSPRVRQAIESAVAWYEASKIPGKRYEKVTGPQYEFGVDRILTDDPAAPPLWARFYEIDTNRPFFANRDGKKVYSLDQVSPERRAKYAWYGNWGQPVLNAYPKWRQRMAQRGAEPATRLVPASDAGRSATRPTGSR